MESDTKLIQRVESMIKEERFIARFIGFLLGVIFIWIIGLFNIEFIYLAVIVTLAYVVYEVIEHNK